MNNQEWKRAKEYALKSLTRCDQTEWQIRQKLERKGYSSQVTEQVLLFLKEYQYIDDQRFLEQYIACHCNRLNRRQLLEHLYRKGIYQEDIDEYLERYQYDEGRLLQKAVEKYMKNKDWSDPVMRRKATAYLMQKGYSYTMIRSIINMEEVPEFC